MVLAAGALAVVAACDAAPPATPPPTAEPPAPPAACLLDGAALAAATGVTWTPDATTASDTRCVYDGGAGPGGPIFLTVTLGPLTQADPAAEIESLAPLCDKGSRVAITAARGGFTCRFGRAQVFGTLVRDDRVVTVAASGVPAATTPDRLAEGVRQQLLRGG